MTLTPPAAPAHYSKRCRFTTAVLFSLLLVGAANAAQTAAKRPAPAAPSAPAITEQAELGVIALTNALRAGNGLPPLAADARVAESARAFAAYLAGSGKLEHDADGTTPGERAKQRGYSPCMVAENLASEYASAGFTADALARNVVNGWSESPTHRANLLQPDLTHVGVGVARSAIDGEYFVVQVLTRPLEKNLKFRVTNRTATVVRYEFRSRPVTLGPKQARTHESCVAGSLRLAQTAADSAVRTKDGGRYVIIDADGALRVREE